MAGRKKGRVFRAAPGLLNDPWSAGGGSESLDGGGGVGFVENRAVGVENSEGAEWPARRQELGDAELDFGISITQNGELPDAEVALAGNVDNPRGFFVL